MPQVELDENNLQNLLEIWLKKRVFNVTNSSSKDAYQAFKSLCSAGHGMSTIPKVYLDLFSLLLSQIQSRHLERSFRLKIEILCATLSPEVQIQLARGLFQGNDNLLAFSFVFDHLASTVSCDDILNSGGMPTKKQIIEAFVAEYVLTKTRKSPYALQQISSNILAHIVGNDELQELLMPAIQKALLRSPESVIEAVSFILLGINVELNSYAVDLGKTFAATLHFQNDATREEAVFASECLVQLISDKDILIAVLDRYFAVLSGAEGRLTVASHKICILKAVQKMVKCRVNPEELCSVASFVLEKCVKFQESEVHEGTVIGCFDTMTAWSLSLGNSLPQIFTGSVTKALANLKHPLRTYYCIVLVSIYKNPRAALIEPSLSSVLKSFEALSTQLFQAPSLSEAISLAVVIRTAASSGLTIPVQFLTLTKSPMKHFNAKFFSTCNHKSIPHVALLAESILMEDYNVADDNLFQALAMTLTVAEYEVRDEVKGIVTRIFGYIKNLQVCRDLISALEYVFATTTILHHIKEEIVIFLAKLCSSIVTGEDYKSVAVDLIWLCHDSSREYIWIEMMRKAGLQTENLHCELIVSLFKKHVLEFDGSKTGMKIVQTLSMIYGSILVEVVVQQFQQIMKDPRVANVLAEEYVIYLTPEGELYDTSVLYSETEGQRNVKRESKVYSYKEQLEEIQLKKELDEQRRKVGKVVPLTTKQKEAMKTQLEKESVIRANLKDLELKIEKGVQLVESAMQGNSAETGCCLKDFVWTIFELMGNPLASLHCSNLFRGMAKFIFSSFPSIGDAVSELVLRLVNATAGGKKAGVTESDINSMRSVLGKLVKVESFEFTSSIYTYCYPLLEQVVQYYTNQPDLVSFTLACTKSAVNSTSRNNIHNPAYIPRSKLCKLLYQLIGTSEGVLQQQAVSALLDFSKSSLFHGNSTIAKSTELHSHLEAVLSHLAVSRETGVRCLSKYQNVNNVHKMTPDLEERMRSNIFRERFDPEERISEFAFDVWSNAHYKLDFELHKDILAGVVQSCEQVRVSSGRAMAFLLEEFPDNAENIINVLISTYDEYLVMTPPVLDSFGRLLEEGIDKWEGRHGVGIAIKQCAHLLSAGTAKTTVNWIVATSLADRNQDVHSVMLEAAIQVVAFSGKDCFNDFATVIETFLDKPDNRSVPDNVRQACVVLMGCLARHLDPSDERVKSIFDTLLDTLSTPSEKVQQAVAHCLPALVPAIAQDSVTVMDGLIKKLMDAESYGERRGAAYGLAGMIKGLGILSLKQHDIMNILAEGMQDKKNYRRREGSLMALELLCEFLGRLFEPYIVHVLPYLLQCLGDSNQYVREATENTARSVMSRLSGHGVKLVLPSLITALNEDSWRTKCGSVDLLGRMAYCAPKQLSACLPMIVPRLIEVLSDSHIKVQDAGAKALRLIGSVIRNPEIQYVVPVLLQALQDPAKKTSPCLQALLVTEFVHFVDPPSLALIMPVIQRAFQDRSTENRKMTAQIIGNMYSLTDHSDLAPYMDHVMPGLKTSLVDPVPEVRGVSAKALGAMAKGMGEKCYDELLPWLMRTLVSEANSVDRSGAAQGLAEVIGALGEDKLEKFMPEIIRKADSDDIAPHVRDGYMMMFIYMPSVFEDAFVPYIGQIINPILKALADENEFVRETALRAGQRIVSGFAETAITLLLPQLEQGIFDDNWRIRFSSVQLLGDLLYKISGVSGKMSTESASDDDNFGTEQSQGVIIAALGLARRNRVLSGLYMERSDVALMVRQAALHVWKVVVANTPKTLREILPTLFTLLLSCLASHSHDKRQVAARTLGDLVRKLGEKILPEIIPILERGLDSELSVERQGVCIGLSEIMASTSRDTVIAFVDNLVPTLRKALCDPSGDVREAAAQTFGSLHANVGGRALDEILPFMLRKLDDPEDGDFALDGLGHVMMIKSKAVMPYLIPQLTAPPANTKALAELSSVAGDSLSRHLNKILPALILVLKEADETTFENEMKNCERVVLAVMDDHGVRLLVNELLEYSQTENIIERKVAVGLLSAFCIRSKANLTVHVSTLLKGLILLLTDEDEIVLRLAAEALAIIIKNLDPTDQVSFVGDIRQAIRFAKSDLKDKVELPGLCFPKGVNAILPVFREALLNGNTEAKEQSALGLGELIELSNADALKPSVIHITGPLIRILGDRYGPSVKVAVLDTLALLLFKVGIHIRAFLPQLQTTFLKAAVDPIRNVRLKAAQALAHLVPTHNKPDPLFLEIFAIVKQAEESTVRDTAIFSMRAMISQGGDKMSEATRKSLTSYLLVLLGSAEESTRLVAGGCLGVLLKWMTLAEMDSTLALLLTDDEDVALRQGRTTAIAVGLKDAAGLIYSEKKRDKIHKSLLNLLSSDKVPLVCNGIRIAGQIFMDCMKNETTLPESIIQPFSKSMNNSSNEVKALICQVCEVMGKSVYPKIIPKELLRYLIPTLVNGTKEKNSVVRASAESALVSILHLRTSDKTLNICQETLESGAKEALTDVVNKVLRRSINQPDGKEPEIDDTILS